MKNIYRLTLALAVMCMLSFSLAPQASAAPGDACVVQPGNAPGTLDWKGTCVLKTAGSTASDTSNEGKQEFAGTCSDFKARKIISEGGFVATVLCTNDNGNAIQTMIESMANYLVGLGTFILALMVAVAGVQIITGGSSPEAIKAGKRRMSLALMSIAALVMARVILDLLGITGGKFLGVPVSSGFNQDTVPNIIRAFTNYVFFAGGVLAVGMIIYGGFVMITSAGNPQRIQSARRVIMYAVIGLVTMVAAGLIIGLVGKALTG